MAKLLIEMSASIDGELTLVIGTYQIEGYDQLHLDHI